MAKLPETGTHLVPSRDNRYDETALAYGHLSLFGESAVPESNRVSNASATAFLPLLKLATDYPNVSLTGILFSGRTFTSGTSTTCNRSLEMNEGKLVATAIRQEGGEFAVLRRGHAVISAYETVGRTFGYSLYLGDCNSSSDYVVDAKVSHSRFHPSSKEAAVRVMGSNAYVLGCVFLSDGWKNNKEFLQVRHGRVRIESCELLMTAFGSLKYNDPGDNGRSFWYADKNPGVFAVLNSTQAGNFHIAGKCKIAIGQVKAIARDLRGIGSSAAIVLTTWKTGETIHSPYVMIRDYDAGPYERLWEGQGTVIVGPNVTVNGAKVPVDADWNEAAWDEAIAESDEYRRRYDQTPPEPVSLMVKVPKNVTRVVLEIER